jgi:hypothetical protein
MMGALFAADGTNKPSNVEPTIQPIALPNTHQPALVRHCFNIKY